MNILVLGGTKFLGRHIVDALASCGHQVTAFHRGQTMAELPNGVEERFGDRNEHFHEVAGERWDAIVDVNCLEPEQIRKSLELRTNRYVFISTVSVYADFSVTGVNEESPAITTFDTADEAAAYGGKKAECERLLLSSQYANRATILRPGLIAGKWDPTGRFTYWPARIMRGGDVLAPGPADRPVQFIDAADVARFVERALAQNICGTFNLIGPEKRTKANELMAECQSVAMERGAPSSRLVWVDARLLHENKVQPWMEMPLWAGDPQWDGILEISNSKALGAGLQLRPIRETITAVFDWVHEAQPEIKAGLSPQRESELLASVMRSGEFPEEELLRE